MAYEILIVDDQKDICDLISDILEEEGYKTTVMTEGHKAIEAIRYQMPDLIILDIWLNDHRFDGIALLDILKQDYPFLPIVMISGHGTIETAVSALKKGAYDFIEKPFQTDRLLSVVARGLEVSNLRRQVSVLRETLSPPDLCGHSAVINSLRQAIERVGKTNSRVMIEGPSGAGKELTARLIHNQSLRSSHPFVIFNCAGVDSETLEEDLFGVEKDAGTPHVSIKLGVLEKAHQGTLFLDCVNDLPLGVQGKLVTILQNNQFCRVGGTRPLHVDVRVISSASPSIHDALKQRKFREDLYYRLNVVPLLLPPLTERIEDIKEIAQHFLNKLGPKEYVEGYRLTEGAETALEAYSWPGNVRQLKNIMEWVLIMHPETTLIDRSMLPPDILQAETETLSMLSDTRFYDMPLREAREEFERRYLLFHMRRFAGNITKTASAVQMERTALHRKIKMLHIAGNEISLEGEKVDALGESL